MADADVFDGGLPRWKSKETEPGAVAYAGYCAASDGKSLVSGAELPSWENLSEDIRVAWRASADAVKMFHELSNPDH